LADIHPATRRFLASWRYRYSVWNLRRFSLEKRSGIVICFLQVARADMIDGIIEMQDKLITAIRNKARKRYEERLRAREKARTRAVEVLEAMETLVLGHSVPDSQLRQHVFDLLSSEDMSRLWKDLGTCERARMARRSAHPSLVRLHAQVLSRVTGQDAVSVCGGFSAPSRGSVSQRSE
jgi:hypothetical protein